MTWMTRLFPRRRLEADLSEEIRGHLQERIDALVSRGMPPRDAARQAHREFGNVTSIEEQAREVWKFQWLEDLFSDVRFALRQLRKSPVFAVTGGLTLALGIGANTAVFSVVNAVMLRALPFPEAESLVSVSPRGTNGPAGPYNVSYPNFFDLRNANTVFQHLVSYRSTPISLTGSGEPQAAILVSAGLVIGIAGSLVAWRAIGALLFGMAGGPSFLLAVAVSVVLATTWLATYLPARRAASIDPLVALRTE